MRADSLGMFWRDIDDKSQKKIKLLTENDYVEVLAGYWVEKHVVENDLDIYDYVRKTDEIYDEIRSQANAKCVPPNPVWLSPDYLPHIEEARSFKIDLFTDSELVEAASERFVTCKKHRMVFDVECYINYYLIAFRSISLGKIVFCEMIDDVGLDLAKLNWIVNNFCIVGFNSNGYDMHILALSLHGCSNAQMKCATSAIIERGERGYQVLKSYKAKQLKEVDTMDIMEVAPLKASLKVYGGRIHAPRMQDLPFHPSTVLSEPQIAVVRWYCLNDLANTQLLYEALSKDIKLREELSEEMGLDLRSKSDAQIAEAVIADQVSKLNRSRVHRVTIEPGTRYHYKVPHFIQFNSATMQHVLGLVRFAPFVVNEFGKVAMPEALHSLDINIADSTYRMGIGGLHSCEKKTAHFSNKHFKLVDRDVVSYYPRIIINQRLYPEQMGSNFLTTYGSIVERRLAAKAAGNKSTAGTLKIVINGSFGKFGSMYSTLYSPNLLIQVTITGQLSLLMLIERLELAGINVVSANTDGVVIKCHRTMESQMDAIVKQWEIDTQYETEAVEYAALYSRDVNNYIAVKIDGPMDERIKAKGAYSRAGLSKNPTGEVCIDAIEALLLHGTPIEQTIRACTDIRKFVSVRTVKGGAVKDGEFLGKAIRWYYAKDVDGVIVYANSGKKVPKSDGAKPMMDMPNEFPKDVDYEAYEKEVRKMLKVMGAE